MSIADSIILGLVQGITEFLPISSSGHLILGRKLLSITTDSSLSFDIFVHLAALIAIVVTFWGDLKRIVIDMFTEGASSRSKKLIWAIIVGALPAAVMGYFFSGMIDEVFRNVRLTAYSLIAGSIVFLIADRIPKAGEGISILKGLFVGIFQTFALIPGISRSGITISGGLFFGLSREEAIRFAFLLGIPTILGAWLNTFLDLDGGIAYNEPYIWTGFFAALFSGLISIKFLVKFLTRHSFNVFIVYRLLLAGVILYLF